MIRNDLTAGSAHRIMTMRANNTPQQLFRLTAGGNTSTANGAAASVPYWVRVQRVGSTFSVYDSADGATWTKIGSNQTITMGTIADVGLVVDSVTTGLQSATFDNVTITTP